MIRWLLKFEIFQDCTRFILLCRDSAYLYLGLGAWKIKENYLQCRIDLWRYSLTKWAWKTWFPCIKIIIWWKCAKCFRNVQGWWHKRKLLFYCMKECVCSQYNSRYKGGYRIWIKSTYWSHKFTSFSKCCIF